MGKLYKNIEAWIKSNSSDEAKVLEIEALFENREKELLNLLTKCFELLPDGDYPEILINIKREVFPYLHRACPAFLEKEGSSVRYVQGEDF